MIVFKIALTALVLMLVFGWVGSALDEDVFFALAALSGIVMIGCGIASIWMYL